jgi:hypothetical protein
MALILVLIVASVFVRSTPLRLTAPGARHPLQRLRAIVRVGDTRRVSVRRGIAGNIVIAPIIIIPVTALNAAIFSATTALIV